MSDRSFDSKQGYMRFEETTVIRRCYQRNNRKGGQKNMRCFPNCCSGVHATTGYCGGAIFVEVDRTGLDKNTILLAEFCPVLNSRPKGLIDLDDIWSVEDLQERSQKEINPLAPLYVGSIAKLDDDDDSSTHEDVVSTYCFNQTRKGWHYGFVSNKHVSEMHHALAVYLMEKLPNGQFQCIDVLYSVTFSIYCRRRAKTSRLGEILSASNHESPLKSAEKVETRKRKKNEESETAASPLAVTPRASDSDWQILSSLLHEMEVLNQIQNSSDDDDTEVDSVKSSPTQSKRTKTVNILPHDFQSPYPIHSMVQSKTVSSINDVATYKHGHLKSNESSSCIKLEMQPAYTCSSAIYPAPSFIVEEQYTQSAPLPAKALHQFEIFSHSVPHHRPYYDTYNQHQSHASHLNDYYYPTDVTSSPVCPSDTVYHPSLDTPLNLSSFLDELLLDDSDAIECSLSSYAATRSFPATLLSIQQL